MYLFNSVLVRILELGNCDFYPPSIFSGLCNPQCVANLLQKADTKNDPILRLVCWSAENNIGRIEILEKFTKFPPNLLSSPLDVQLTTFQTKVISFN